MRPLWEHPPALTEGQQWAQWEKDVRRIYTETVYAFKNRLVYRELWRIFSENPKLKANGGFIWTWIKCIYGRDQVLAIGREVDKHTEVINLIQLMYQMIQRPKVISRTRFMTMLDLDNPEKNRSELLKEVLRESNNRWFSENIGDGEYLDLAKIKKDRNWIEKQCKAVMKYRHKVVAHRSPMELTLTIEQIDKALDAIEKMLQKYYLLFTGASLMGAEPAIQFDWHDVFTYPWIDQKRDEDE